MKEEWRSVIDYEGLYEVSSCGQIKSLRKGALLTPHKINGYYVVRLCKNGKMKNHKVHRLVAIAFIPNPENKAFVDHIDTNRSNNRVENLRWVTRQENYDNPISQKRQKESVMRQVLQYDLEGNLINAFPSITDASKKTGVRISAIHQSCSGHTITSKGYIWRFKEDATSVSEVVARNKKPKTAKRKVEALLNGEIIVFESMCRAAKELNISRDILRVHNSFGNISWKLI